MSVTDKELFEAARRATERAYVPYSHFPVGAAVLAADGRIYEGCNVENASYGLTMCAERTAIFRAIASGGQRIVKVAIFTPTPTPAPPCGACRQVIHELGQDAEVLSFCSGPDVIRAQVSDLLPATFGPSHMTM